MSKIIIHIGTHKTATTTIQRFLSKNRELLKERGVWYPNYDLIGKKGHYAHLGIVNAFSGQHPTMTKLDASEFFKAVDDGSRNYEVTILSAEPLYRHIASVSKPEELTSDLDQYWAGREKYIESIRSLFPSNNVSVAVTFRRQADYAASLYQEHVKTGNYRGNFREFRNEFWFHFAYLRQARAWRKHFDELIAVRFEEILSENDPAAAFVKLIGVDVDGLERIPPQNEGLEPDLVILKRMLHQANYAKNDALSIVNDLRKQFSSGELAALRDRSLFTCGQERREFQESFSQENDILGEEFFPNINNDEPVFPKFFFRSGRPDPKFGDSLSPDFVAKLTSSALVR